MKRERVVRSDALPEHVNYLDSGCSLFSACLSCPLARCRYETEGGAVAILKAERDELIRQRREQGAAVAAIAVQFQVTRRTVFRVLSDVETIATEGIHA